MSLDKASQSKTKPGSLIIAGSGIASVAHITLETISYMKNADKTFYLVCDPITESFINENSSDTFDLAVFYDKGKERYQSYVEMAEVMLKEVRAGRDVLGIFYGHPGVFVSPAHRALTLARNEGYQAKMLPGVSAEDSMFADLEIEPAEHGCMTSEATELLARNRPLNTSVHNIIWQVGTIGITKVDFENSKFNMLVDRLEREFGPDHKVVQYVGAVTPQSRGAMVVYTIDELRNEQIAKHISEASTFYIPPRDIAPTNAAIAAQLELPNVTMGLLSATPRWDGPRFVSAADYGPFEKHVVEQLEQRGVPDSRPALHASSAMRQFMTKLALEPKLRQDYKANPAAVVDKVPGLTDRERFALRLNHDGPTRAIMSRPTAEEPTEEELELAAISDSAVYPAHHTPYAVFVAV